MDSYAKYLSKSSSLIVGIYYGSSLDDSDFFSSSSNVGLNTLNPDADVLVIIS